MAARRSGRRKRTEAGNQDFFFFLKKRKEEIEKKAVNHGRLLQPFECGSVASQTRETKEKKKKKRKTGAAPPRIFPRRTLPLRALLSVAASGGQCALNLVLPACLPKPPLRLFLDFFFFLKKKLFSFLRRYFFSLAGSFCCHFVVLFFSLSFFFFFIGPPSIRSCWSVFLHRILFNLLDPFIFLAHIHLLHIVLHPHCTPYVLVCCEPVLLVHMGSSL